MGIETLAAASIGTALLGAGVSAYGQEKSADAQVQSNQYKAAVALQNEKLAREQGGVEAANLRGKVGGLISKQTAAQGASGIDVGGKTATDVRASTAELGELDAQTILYNSMLKGLGFSQEATMASKTAGYAKTAGDISAASSLLGGASSAFGKFAGFKNQGTF